MISDYGHLEAVYALAVERGDYRRGAWIAVRALRTLQQTAIWRVRLIGCLARRHGA